jgi:predicted O-methyltransferase YrrM
MWIADYAGMENPGPDFVRQELRRLGHKGECEFVDGNSRETVPRYFAAHAQDYFDVVTVDGDHTTAGAAADLRNVIDRVKVGGLLTFDDTDNTGHPGLAAVWDRVVGHDPRSASVVFNEVGFGIAVAMRKF